MANADGRNRPPEEDEGVPLLHATSDREPSPHLAGDNTRRQSWFAVLWRVYQATTIELLLWVFVPLGLVSGAFSWTSILTSIFNFLAIIPLSAAVSDFSDTLSEEFGDLLGALINATFGNAVELIVGILAVVHGNTRLAQSVMIGSILSDILFVLGSCFFVSALEKPVRDLNAAVTSALSSLMIITAVALILPTALYSTLEPGPDVEHQILGFSRGTAIVLLVLYIVYLYFELGSHKYLFEEQPQPDRSTGHVNGGNDHVAMEQDTQTGAEQSALENMNQVTELGSQQGTEQNARQNLPQITGGDTRRDTQRDGQQNTEHATQQVTSSSLLITFTGLLCCAIGIMLCSHFFLDSIDNTSKVTGISKTFIATILIPVASNAPECATVVGTVVGTSRSDRVDFAVGVIVSSILQIALFIIPVLVMLGWIVQQPMTLNFETFQTIILFLAIVLVNHLLQNGKYTYMHGLVLIGLYAVIAVAFFLRHDIL